MISSGSDTRTQPARTVTFTIARTVESLKMSDLHALKSQINERAEALKLVLDSHLFSQATRNTLHSQIEWAVERFFDELEKSQKGKS